MAETNKNLSRAQKHQIVCLILYYVRTDRENLIIPRDLSERIASQFHICEKTVRRIWNQWLTETQAGVSPDNLFESKKRKTDDHPFGRPPKLIAAEHSMPRPIELDAHEISRQLQPNSSSLNF
jgi:hypothetical protein